MENTGALSAADVIALTKGNDNGFLGGGNVGGILALIIVFILLFGNGGWGNTNAATALGQSDLQNSLYFQSQDNAIRGLAQGQCNLTDTVLTASYNNLISYKDMSQQLANSIAGISTQIAEQGNMTRALIQQNYISELSDKLQTTRDALNNEQQTRTLTDAITGQTGVLLNSLGKWRAYPPCYDNCGCNGLY